MTVNFPSFPCLRAIAYLLELFLRTDCFFSFADPFFALADPFFFFSFVGSCTLPAAPRMVRSRYLLIASQTRTVNVRVPCSILWMYLR